LQASLLEDRTRAMSTSTTPISSDQQPRAWQRADTVLLAALLALCAAWIALRIHWSWVPMEDAAMLLRYSQHLAAGHGIRWSLNQPPVDGATDFLFMAATAAVAHLMHLSVITASRWVNIFAQIVSVAIVFAGSRRILGGNRWLSAAMALYLIAGPFTALCNACFGAPLLAMFLLVCWCAGLHYVQRPAWAVAFIMAIRGLLAGLTRPEGVLIALILLAAIIYLVLEENRVPHVSVLSLRRMRRGFAGSIPLLTMYVLVFGLLGGTYFAWHWHTFGYPLPNPFYIKGNGHLYPSSVQHAAMNLALLLLPVLPLLPLGWLAPLTRRLTTALFGVLIAFTLLWILLNNGSNHFMRFQYVMLPLVLMTAPALASGLTTLLPLPRFADWPQPQRNALCATAALAVVAATLYSSRIANYQQTAWGMRDFALRLAPLAPRGYTMAVTEAGALPLYSDWNTIDGLGLNDAYVAHHHGELTADYLDRTHPELIMVHIDRNIPYEFIPDAFLHPPAEGTGGYDTAFLNYYAATHDYTLAAAWGADQCNLHLYWLHPGFPDYETVLSDIRDHPYVFLDDAFTSHDYRNEMDSTRVCAAPDGPQTGR
jgi:hypothetical protein